jgi:TatD DNase family protein
VKHWLYDAHNHLQDGRLAPHRESVLAAVHQENVVRMVVNGSSEADWPEVLELARSCPEVLPSFGCHPWHVEERTADWQKSLVGHLDAAPSAIGEIGLDLWIKDHNIEEQEQVFVWQLRLAAERGLPVSIHCLQAWGRLLDILRAEPRPQCGFLLHSYGGPQEIVAPLAELGAYFSLPGHFAHERKARQREAFRAVPPDRLLIETDAPDQLLPPEQIRYPLTDVHTGKAINHPANLGAVYQFASELLNEPMEALTKRVEANFRRLFGPVMFPKDARRPKGTASL